MSGNHELNNLAAPIPQAQPEPEVHEPTPSATSPQHREAEANVQQGIQGETSQDGEQKFSVIIWLAGLRKKASFWIFNGLILAFTCFQLWPAITTQHDTRTTLSLAQWTAKKDFLEWCNSQDAEKLTEECIFAQRQGLSAPPVSSDLVSGDRKRQLLRLALPQATNVVLYFLVSCGFALLYLLIICGRTFMWLFLILSAELRKLQLRLSRTTIASWDATSGTNALVLLVNERVFDEVMVPVQPKVTPPLGEQEAECHPEHSNKTQTYNPSGLEAGLYRDSSPQVVGSSSHALRTTMRTLALRSDQQGISYGASTFHADSCGREAYTGYVGTVTDPPNPQHLSTPNTRWWISAEGIRRDVIQADLHRYLGPEAIVRPGEGRDADKGRNGYWITAYRTLTPVSLKTAAEPARTYNMKLMIQDLKADSVNFERSGDTGRYENSMAHQSRQHWGPTSSEAAPVSLGSNSAFLSNSYASRMSYSSAHSYGNANSNHRNTNNTYRNVNYDFRNVNYDTSGYQIPAGYYLASDGRYYPEPSKTNGSSP